MNRPVALLVAVAAMTATFIPSADAAATVVTSAVAHDAGAMAATIRTQARRTGAGTRVENEAAVNGGHLLVVWVLAGSGGSFRNPGVYQMRLLTGRSGEIRNVRVWEYTAPAHYRFGQSGLGLLYGFAISPIGAQWRVEVAYPYRPHRYYNEFSYSTGRIPGSPKEPALTLPVLNSLYGEAAPVLEDAKRRAPVGEARYLDPGLPPAP
ncbi:MAG: hypothetical protein JWN10_2624 [Solirubrobacterales bacterium]|nr:hypothetical protein [Solirubrobacterales bacterium]